MKKILPLFILLAFAYHIQAQSVGIGTTTPNASAALEVKATDKGLLIPVMTTTLRNAIVTPAKGLMVYDSIVKAFYYYTGTAWKSFANANMLSDADGNTTIEVERTPNDDAIRFKSGGTDVMVIGKNGKGVHHYLAFPLLDSNLIIGRTAGFNMPAIGPKFNTFLGISSGLNDTTGSSNTYLGNFTGTNNYTGNFNVAVGSNAAFQNNFNPVFGIWQLNNDTRILVFTLHNYTTYTLVQITLKPVTA